MNKKRFKISADLYDQILSRYYTEYQQTYVWDQESVSDYLEFGPWFSYCYHGLSIQEAYLDRYRMVCEPHCIYGTEVDYVMFLLTSSFN